ncbi:MAG: exodeoxyribonuclease V subunit gamma [Bacilli bacterium]|nr:exodeoxyribonuclease V subunit gamma [Bacilli bacterium]
MKERQLTILADALIKEIKDKKDPFVTTTIVFPNVFIKQWFTAYWLKNQGDNVLMNVEYKTLNEALNLIVMQPNYYLISPGALKEVIISLLINDEDNIIPEEYKNYYRNSPVKLNDFASSLAALFLNYYRDDLEGLKNWDESNYQYNLYYKIIEELKKYRLGTIDRPIPKKDNQRIIHLFGFVKLDKVYRHLIDQCPNIKEYSLIVEDKENKNYSILKAPSLLREIEAIHSRILTLMHEGAKASDFLIVGPHIEEYQYVIERVFHQNDQEYPSIPYVIRYALKEESDITKILSLLFKIYKNGFYTRLDFYNLINIPLIKEIRNIQEEEITNWMKTIVQLNIHRNHEYLDEWDYLKKRLLLSKVSSINFDDNLISLSDGDYLPYSNTQFNDESIVKLVDIINDIASFTNLLKDKEYIDNEFIDLLKEQLDRWCLSSINNNNQYQKVINNMEIFKYLPNDKIPLDVFFYCLIDDSYTSNVQKGNAFLSGVTFINFDINSIISNKYIFFIGGSSNHMPTSVEKNELDLRKNIINDDEELAFSLIAQNALDHLYISYVGKDLKTDEEYYLSPIINAFNKKNGLYQDNQYDDIDIDETRPYKELFTRKEFNEKKYYTNLINHQGFAEENKKEDTQIDKKFLEVVTVSNMADFLKEPLQYKIISLFNKADDLQKKIKEEYEPFAPNNLDESNIERHILIDLVNNSLDEDKLLKSLKLGNLIPSINEELQKGTFNEAKRIALEAYDIIEDSSNNSFTIVPPREIKLIDNDNREWNLISNNDMCRYIEKDTRYYFELKRMNKKVGVDDFLSIYILSLMDIASLKEEKEYEVILVKGKEDDIDLKDAKYKYSPSYRRSYFVTPDRAKELLNNIHEAMGDYNEITSSIRRRIFIFRIF